MDQLDDPAESMGCRRYRSSALSMGMGLRAFFTIILNFPHRCAEIISALGSHGEHIAAGRCSL